jgi:4'-phosphopantetheinyl transferase
MTSGAFGDGDVKNEWQPNTFRLLDDPIVEVVGAHLDVPADVCEAQYSLLSGHERERANRFRFALHRQHYIIARAILRRLLAERLRVKPAAIELMETENGKPKLGTAHAASHLEFNLSHSGSLVLYAFTHGVPVGIDVELIRDIPDADHLAENFFSATEIASLRALPPNRRLLAFLACWTRKEAFIKALGEGLTCPLDSFDVTVDPDAPARIIRIGKRSGTLIQWTMRAFRPFPEYIAAFSHPLIR